MGQSEQKTVQDIVEVIQGSTGDWRTPGGIARDLRISPETVIQIAENYPQVFILSNDGRARPALLPNSIVAVSLTDNARDLYLQG